MNVVLMLLFIITCIIYRCSLYHTMVVSFIIAFVIMYTEKEAKASNNIYLI